MSRSPWRAALDGQAYLIRELRSPANTVHIGQMFNVVGLARGMDRGKLAKIQVRAGSALVEGLETLMREAEPIYLTHDIVEHVWKNVQRKKAQLPEAQLTDDMLPIRNGLVWFGDRGYELVDIPNSDDPMGEFDNTGGSVVIRALYFGDEPRVTIENTLGGYDIRVETGQPTEKLKGLGVTIFLDSRRSGYVNLTREFGDHALATPLGCWEFGTPLKDFLGEEAETERAVGVNETGTLYLMTMCHGFLYHLFLLMLQRITLWGGVGLNRSEQQQAERERLRPRVQLVTWRKANYQYPNGHIPVPISWSCRWSVREHYRRYKNGKVVKIKSYVKGPEGKPFRLPVDRAHMVKR